MVVRGRAAPVRRCRRARRRRRLIAGRFLPLLNEASLDETQILDPNDRTNITMYLPNGAARRQLLPLNRNPDYSGDRVAPDPPFEDPPFETAVSGDPNRAPGMTPPAACRPSPANETLTGFDDWVAISIPFRHDGDAANAPRNLVDEAGMPTHEEFLAFERQLNTIDLSVAVVDTPDPVQAGGRSTTPSPSGMTGRGRPRSRRSR